MHNWRNYSVKRTSDDSDQSICDSSQHYNGEYPADLDVFIDKKMLFKVEITYGNLKHGWRNYAVKRVEVTLPIL
jgi:hypothetical protein